MSALHPHPPSLASAIEMRAGSDLLDFKLYRYVPSLAGGAAAAGIFGLLLLAHVIRMWRCKSWYFVPFIIGILFEASGYAARVASSNNTTALGPFIAQALTILVAPALYAATIYMTLGRLIRALRADALSVVPVRWLTRLFVIADVFSFAMQSGGGGIQATGNLSSFDTGAKIIVGGLFVQILFFGFFLATCVVFHVRVRRVNAQQKGGAGRFAEAEMAARGRIPWRRHLAALYAVSVLILARSIFRVVEYLQGNSGYLVAHEVFLYVFDAVPMALVPLILLIWYPGGLSADKAVVRGRLDSGNDSDTMLEEGVVDRSSPLK